MNHDKNEPTGDELFDVTTWPNWMTKAVFKYHLDTITMFLFSAAMFIQTSTAWYQIITFLTLILGHSLFKLTLARAYKTHIKTVLGLTDGATQIIPHKSRVEQQQGHDGDEKDEHE